ncbi:hypothetical protein QAD02_014161 [Eretmocerus hayati]|uniref:Uncharacterized protein n=1 Tax=Eretmocerus hayati TaxID=131215 RepID=A0ACC2P4X4_9HYME|nr:hypothetical protein QAD02_014161 [Eretmocerus hayati]
MIICSKDLYKKYGPHAKLYFDRFALLGEVVYGLDFVSLSVHSLTHLVEDTENMDCLVTEVDAFPYENELRFVKKHIKSGYKPLPQLCKKVERDLEFSKEKVSLPPELQILKSRTIEGIIHVQKLIYRGFEISPKKPNNCIYLTDGSIIRVADFISFSHTPTPDQVLILGSRLKLLGSPYDYPTSSTHLGIYKVSEDHDAAIIQIPLKKMKCKAVVFDIFELPNDPKVTISVPMLH